MLHAAEVQITTPSDNEILITREFNAPRQLVFDATSRPELLKRWLSGPPGWSMVESEGDARVGGTYRHLWHGPENQQMSMCGVYREVVAPERIARTEKFIFGCEAQAGEQLATMVLTEVGSRTVLHITVRYESKAARDATLASGMERGITASYENLDQLLESIQ
jgi:uncharacterized protein YndB with AHSA1/START domain